MRRGTVPGFRRLERRSHQRHSGSDVRGSSYINGSLAPPCRGLGRGLKFNATKARAGKPAPFLKVRPMVVRITSLPGLGSARWSTRSGHSKQAGRARPHLGRDGGITTAATWEDPRLPWWLLRRQRPRTPAGVNGTTDMPPSRPSRFSPARESLTSPFVARTSARRRTRHGFTVP
jgi:hypothetical protein